MKEFSERASVIRKQSAEVALAAMSVVIIGVVCGVIGAIFAKSIELVTALREENGFLIYLLPFGGLVTVGLYKLAKTEKIGTIKILGSARGEEKIPVVLMPVIIAATVITHLFGGSAGKEGAALQIGGTVAEAVSKITRADDKKHSVYMICGMAGLFSAVFGTPVGACVFALEVVFAKETIVFAAIPAFFSSIIAYLISIKSGVSPERFEVSAVPDFGFEISGKTLVMAIIVAVVGAGFCCMLHGGEKLLEKLIKNPFVRIFAGGCIIVVLTLIFGTDYNGGGIGVIERVFEEENVNPEAFLLKIVFTVITVSAGYRGGEIVPSFFIGSTLGGVLSPLFGLPTGFGAAIGMTAFFSSVTNCPVASAIIAVELFGTEGFILLALSAFTARLISGKKNLYKK